MTTETLDAMDRAILQIEESGRRAAAHRARLAADPRLQFLGRISAENRMGRASYGMAGGRQMMGWLMSPENSRHLRAKALFHARMYQMDGHHEAVARNLVSAARYRRDEQARRLREVGTK